MKKINHNGHSIELYDSIDEMPIKRFNLYQRFVMIDSGIGSTLQDFDQHLAKALMYHQKGESEKFSNQIENIRQLYMFIIQGTSPKMSTFATLIHKLNGKVIEDLSESGIEKILTKLSKHRFSLGQLNGLLEAFKKKLSSSLRFTSPS